MLLSCSTSDLRKATWLWDATLLERPEEVITFLTEQQFNTVFVQIDPHVELAEYAHFIERATAQHIAVYALDGSPAWVTDDELFYDYFQWLRDYMNRYADAPFQGIHLDVEPYLHPNWHDDTALVVEQFQTMVVRAQQQAASLNLPIEVDLPFWFDEVAYKNEFGEGNVAQWVIEQLDGVTIMAYRNNAEDIIDITKHELQFAQKAKKPLTIAIETMASDEGDFVSFYGQDETYVNEQLRAISKAVRGRSFAGFAIHHYSSFKQLID